MMQQIQGKLLYILNCILQETPLNADSFKDMEQDEWLQLFNLSRLQGVSAFIFEKISKAYQDSKDFPKLPKNVLLNWYAHSTRIEQRMNLIHQKSEEFANEMANRGLHTLVMKGIAVSAYYPNPKHREFGDLDCYLFEKSAEDVVWGTGYEKGNLAAESIGCNVKRNFYKHSHINYKGLEIENHQYFLPIRGRKANKELEKQLRRCIERMSVEKGGSKLISPNADFNALFLTAHAMNHFLYESIKVRHLLDWALFLKAQQNEVDWKSFWQWCDKMHYTRFVKCLNYLCEGYLGVEMTQRMKTTQNDENFQVETLSERVLNDMFTGDSVYGKGSSKLNLRMNLVKNFIVSSWKFHSILQRCMIVELMRQAFSVLWERNPKLE